MTNHRMWFGNKKKMQWVPCPAVGVDYGRAGHHSNLELSNGGAVVRHTLSGARTVSLEWSLAPSREIAKIIDFADGVYGPGYIYWSDPFNRDQNVLSQVFATPSLGTYDGPILEGGKSRPTVSPTPANDYSLPIEQATYTMTSSSTPLKHWVPRPPGHSIWVGAYGSSAGGYVLVQPTKAGSDFGFPTPLIPMPVNSTTRWAQAFTSADGSDGVDISLSGEGTITLAGLAVRVLPDGFTPDNDEFIPGRGHAGLAWNAHPSIEAYSAAMDLQGTSASFTEVAPWQF